MIRNLQYKCSYITYFYGVDTQPNISFYMSVGHCRRATLRNHECGISLLVPPRDKMTFIFKWVGVFLRNCPITAFEHAPRLHACINKFSINLCFSSSSNDNLAQTFIIVPKVYWFGSPCNSGRFFISSNELI